MNSLPRIVTNDRQRQLPTSMLAMSKTKVPMALLSVKSDVLQQEVVTGFMQILFIVSWVLLLYIVDLHISDPTFKILWLI